MNKRVALLVAISILLALLVGCTAPAKKAPAEMTISAATSLKESLDELQSKFEEKYNVKLTINYGGSGTLQKQIEEGAPVDVFISAGAKQIKALEEKNLIDKDTNKDVLGNDLVLIVSNKYSKDVKSIEDLKGKNIKLALGEMSTVPAGQYAEEALKKLNLYSELEKNFVFAKDVKAVLNYVEMGEADVGIVYLSDAKGMKEGYIAYTFPEESHRPILYTATVVSASKAKDLSKDFITFIGNADAKAVFEKYGFKVK